MVCLTLYLGSCHDARGQRTLSHPVAMMDTCRKEF